MKSTTAWALRGPTVMVVYPFPLRDDFLARLDLPADLTGEETDRLIMFIDSLVCPLACRP